MRAKADFENGTIELVVSRRNLLTLLAKLDGHPPYSACAIHGGEEAHGFILKAEEDDVHYANRPAGVMHPDTEIVVADIPQSD